MISYDNALQIIFKNNPVRQTENFPLLSALGKISAVDIESAMDVPSFRNSAMDGFAVISSDIVGATTEFPIALSILGAIAAGDISENENKNGALQIMTGALVPSGFDAVIPIEDVEINGDKVAFTRPAKTNENIRFPGEDVSLGQRVLSNCEEITAERIMLLAARGIAEVKTYKIPNITILSTGKEITDNYNSPLSLGKIYNSNSPYLLARCAVEGLTASYGGIIADDAAVFEARISAIPVGSIIITTGAVSKGTWDFIPESLTKLGANIYFHRVNIRPGKPILFASLPNGSFFFGLPGNPISAAIGFRFFVLPLIRSLQGLKAEQPIMAKLKNNFTKKANFRQFLKAELEINNTGEVQVEISGGQESFKISPMAENNAWVVLEENSNEYKAGDIVPVFLFNSNFGINCTIPKKGVLPCKAA